MAGSDAVGRGESPINGITLFTDQRGYVPSGTWSIGAYQPGAPAAAPSATLSATNVLTTNYGQTSYTFTVTYSSAAGITPSSLAASVVTVLSPDGTPITAVAGTPVANGPTDPFGDARSFTVTYTITPPGGSWTSADNGTYTVELGGTTPISATDGSTIPVGTQFGTFDVATGKFAVNKFGLHMNPRNHQWSGAITLTNTGRTVFSGTIYLLFDLPTGAVLENAAGSGAIPGDPTNTLPYLEITVSKLAAGATTAPITAVYNENVAPGSYSTSYYVGF
jgi:hypothetical protein